MVQSKGLIFKSPPSGIPVPAKDLVIEACDFDINQLPPPGGLTTKNIYASFDPYMRARMRSPELKSYKPPYTIGEPITAHMIARVLKSDHPKFREGDWIRASYVSIEEYGVITTECMKNSVTKLENSSGLDPIQFLGALGNPGLTAYASFYDIGKPKRGEVIFISAASGAVGQIAGQLAKHEGLTVIGSVGSNEKLDFILHELGFDAGFNYKVEKPANALKRLAPEGIDIYFENVGGEHLEAALDSMNNYGRIIACGMISESSAPQEKKYGVKNLVLIITKSLTMRGFTVSDKNGIGPMYAKEHYEKVSKLLREGTFKTKISITQGIDNAAVGFVEMLEGKNFGKAVLQIADNEQ